MMSYLIYGLSCTCCCLAFVFFILLIVGIIGLGVWTSRLVRSSSDFFVAGRSMGPGLVLASMLAAMTLSETIVFDSVAARIWNNHGLGRSRIP